MINTPELRTDRLILRKFTEKDIAALYAILSDEKVNTFLPWFPVKSMEEAGLFYEERYASKYRLSQAYAYAVCLKEDHVPVGYIGVDSEEPYDFGYGLRQDCWGKGIIPEAGKALTARVKADGIPFVTATHDIRNPASGRVMQKLGMKYCYSYVELWQPKGIQVTFRMYQLNLDGDNSFVCMKYWNMYDNHFIETMDF